MSPSNISICNIHGRVSANIHVGVQEFGGHGALNLAREPTAVQAQQECSKKYERKLVNRSQGLAVLISCLNEKMH